MVKANLKEIREALKIAGKVVDRKSSMPILHHVLLSTEYNGRGMNLKMIATDLENTLIYRIPLEGNTRIPEICVNYAALAKTVSAAGKRSVLELDYQDDELAAVIGRGRYPFDNKLKRDDFPRTPDIDSFESEGGGVFPARELHDALAKVAPALSDDEMRRSLSGVFFDAGRGGRLVGTDGHRLHISRRLILKASILIPFYPAAPFPRFTSSLRARTGTRLLCAVKTFFFSRKRALARALRNTGL